MVAGVCLLTQCVDDQATVAPDEKPITEVSQFANFAGSNTCAGCHKDVYDQHIKTAHFLSSRQATSEYLKGNFMPGSNIFMFRKNVEVRMEKRDSGYYQVGYVDGVEKKAAKFDIVVGSSTKGQSYLHWAGNELTQLPITWFQPANQWSNSPGYPGQLLWNRPISARCIECHTTYAFKTTPENKNPELFRREELILGVDCEKCHGAAAKHVDFHQKNPADTVAKFVVNPADLTRQQKLDLCALCHGGRINKTKPSFSYTVGQKLTDYFTIDTVGTSVQSIDVHGNQFGLMAASECFKKSDMTCNSCHGPHEREKGNLQLYSSRCMNCHTTGHEKVCKLTAVKGAVINKNCIDCHMPKQPSRSIAVMVQGSTTPMPVMMRTHLIKPYPGEAKKVIAFVDKNLNSKSKK